MIVQYNDSVQLSSRQYRPHTWHPDCLPVDDLTSTPPRPPCLPQVSACLADDDVMLCLRSAVPASGVCVSGR